MNLCLFQEEVFLMIFRELLSVVNFSLKVELSGKIKQYKKTLDIHDDYMDFEVKKIEALDNYILIKLKKPDKVPTLEELGYSFEVGV